MSAFIPPSYQCPQCGAEMNGTDGRFMDTAVSAEIIDRARDPLTRKAYVRKRRMEFCSAECASHYQMGCEG